MRGRPFQKGDDPRRTKTGRPLGRGSIPDLLRKIGRQHLPKAVKDDLTKAGVAGIAKDRTMLEGLMRVVYARAFDGEAWAIQFIAERTEGKVKDTLALEGGAALIVVEQLVEPSRANADG